GLGVRVVRQEAGRRAVEDGDRAALGHGGAVVVGDRRVVGRADGYTAVRCAAGLGVRRADGRAVVAGFVGEGVGRGLAAVVAVADGSFSVAGPAAVCPLSLHGALPIFGLGVRVVRQEAGRRAVEDGDRAALGHGGAVVVGDRR